jgi:hypothetical protein
MEERSVVQLIIILVGVVFVIFEIIMNLNDVPGDTTNIILFEATKKRLLFIPFAIGAISGHLFLGTDKKIFPCHKIIPFLSNELLVILGMLVISLMLFLFSKKIKNRSTGFITFLLITGMLYGHFFWSMNDPENCLR